MAVMPPIWPERFLKVIAERDRARDVAVRLEQENAAMRIRVVLLARDLASMDASCAIDLEAWPAAKALVRHVEKAGGLS